MLKSGNVRLFIRQISKIGFFRDQQGFNANYEVISALEFRGSIDHSGESHGHYICDVQDKTTNSWFRTNDNSYPVPIQPDAVTKKAYVVLLKRSN